MKKLLLILLALFSTSFGFSQSCVDVLDPEYTGCNGDTITLDATCTDAISFQWFKDAVLIPDETMATLDVTQEGMYDVEVTTNGGVKISERM